MTHDKEIEALIDRRLKEIWTFNEWENAIKKFMGLMAPEDLKCVCKTSPKPK